MEKVLKAICLTDDLRMERMEALVHDLSSALEESSRLVTTRRRWGMRRRTRSTGNLMLTVTRTASDDSSSSFGAAERGDGTTPRGDRVNHRQSDSDESMQRSFSLAAMTRRAHLHGGNFESDSFNENFSPVHPNTRRKRKLKRMETSGPDHATTSRPAPPAGPAAPPPPVSATKKKRILRHHAPDCQTALSSLLCGKRKRSLRERSLDCGGGGEVAAAATAPASRHKTRGGGGCLRAVPGAAGAGDDVQMDCSGAADSLQCDMMSSSSLSSSESDNGIYTNDEGREGDDEQSDWIGETTGSRAWWDEGEASDTDREDDTAGFQTLINGAPMTDEAYRQLCRESKSGREIRSGRRRVRSNRPGFSIVTSANEKLSRFLQDPKQLRLRLHPMQRREREQLCHLANLYSLELTSELACPILTKTGATVRCADPSAALTRLRLHHHGLAADCKRRRWAPPCMHAGGGPAAQPILAPPVFNLAASNSHVGAASVMLAAPSGSHVPRTLAWEPGPSTSCAPHHPPAAPRHRHLGYKSS